MTGGIKSRIFISFILFCALALFVPVSASAGTAGSKLGYVEDEVLALSDQDSNQITQQAIEAISGATIQKKIAFPKSRISKKNTGKNQSVIRIKLPKNKTVAQAIAEAKSKGLRVEPNYRVRITSVPNDELFKYMWSLQNTGQTGGTANADIDATSAWNITTGSDDVIIAIIDTGIDYNHPDLAANIWTNPGEIAGNGLDDDHNGYIDDVHGYDFCTYGGHSRDSDPMDEHGHGSHVSGTIGAVSNNSAGVTGINWHCKLMSCRFLDEKGYGNTADAIDAINYAVANGAKVLNNSWGGDGYSSSLAAAITNARDNGVLFVAAAGNAGADNDNSDNYPSNYQIDNIIAVAATDDDDALASFSNYGKSTVHLGSPGVNILSTYISNQYAYMSGTSMATPHVSGVAALVLAKYPSISLNELKSRLTWTGDPISSLAGKTITGRRLNAYNALTASPHLMVVEPNDGITWVRGFQWQIQWMSIGGGDTVNIYLIEPNGSTLQLAANTPNTGNYNWDIPASLPAGTSYKILINDGVNTGQNNAGFIISENPADYFTELFSYTRPFDLANKSLMLTPDGSASYYSACIKTITALPTDPARGYTLKMADDDSQLITLGTFSVPFYDANYSSFYVGSNGYITFGSPDYAYAESTTSHFNAKRISGLFHDLNPEAGGAISVKQLDSKVAITWQDVPEYNGSAGNTFQIELFADGRIRLSWLNIDASIGIVGISQGQGVPADYLNSNLSNYGQCEPLLQSLEITGPNSITESNNAQFACTAHFEDAADRNITADGAAWSVDSNAETINDNGILMAGAVPDYRQCTVQAQFSGKSASHKLVVYNNSAHIIPIQKAAVKAGAKAGMDSITLAGGFDATPEIFAAADNVTVQIYSATDNYLVYEQIISPVSFKVKKSVYTYKGASDGITMLQFDTDKNNFQLKAHNIKLTGLRCPFYVLINLGYYTAIGTANENVVNSKKQIPLRLLSGYADTLTVKKATPKYSTKPLNDRLSVSGTFTVSDPNLQGLTEGLTISWGPQTWSIPSDKLLLAKKGMFRCNYRTPNGTYISAVFNFNSCTFTLKITQTDLALITGDVDFGLVFCHFSEIARTAT